ncbi:hypothetical protein G6F64_007807 [Rhizopus arrhizus]|uniref:Uncharacterized protein n=1 Tax=Rhizopus oryzae TaxID=64495 RepID=A0A9P6X692_RHIOR|nr:hypothetical protein G6F64_007807 [Rhizopus arrhizus]
MPVWKQITIPEIPSASYVLVKNISIESSEKTVREFFLFCVALIHFERESAAKTATLLSNALIDQSHIIVSHYFESSVPKEESSLTEEKSQESKPKSRIVAEILANGYILQDQVVAKGLEYDSKYHLSTRLGGYLSALTSNVKQMDDKYRIWDKAIEIDSKFKIQEKVHHATQTAHTTAQTALHSPTGQKVHDLANQTLAQIAAVHYEAKKIQNEKLASHAAASA